MVVCKLRVSEEGEGCFAKGRLNRKESSEKWFWQRGGVERGKKISIRTGSSIKRKSPRNDQENEGRKSVAQRKS